MFLGYLLFCKLNLGWSLCLMLQASWSPEIWVSLVLCLDSGGTLHSGYLSWNVSVLSLVLGFWWHSLLWLSFEKRSQVAALCLLFLFSSFIALPIFDKLWCCAWLYAQGPWCHSGNGCSFGSCVSSDLQECMVACMVELYRIKTGEERISEYR